MATIRIKAPSEEMLRLATPRENRGRASIGMDDRVREYFYISLDKLIPFKNQARSYFNKVELDNLAHSIREYGIRQPLTVIRSPEYEGKFEIVSGERRARAAGLVGLDSVPCIIMTDYSRAEAVAIIENIHRADLHPVELAKAYKSLSDNGTFSSKEEVANSLGVSRSSFYEALKVLELPKDVQQGLIDNNVRSRDKIRLLLKSSAPADTLRRMLNPVRRSRASSSILKIEIKDGNFTIQKDALTKLSPTEREKLKGLLLQLLETL